MPSKLNPKTNYLQNHRLEPAMSYAQIAAELGCSDYTVQRLERSAFAKIRAMRLPVGTVGDPRLPQKTPVWALVRELSEEIGA